MARIDSLLFDNDDSDASSFHNFSQNNTSLGKRMELADCIDSLVDTTTIDDHRKYKFYELSRISDRNLTKLEKLDRDAI